MFWALNRVIGKQIFCFGSLVLLFTASRVSAEEFRPLYRFYDTKIHAHEYTTSEAEAEQWRKDPKMKAEGTLGWVPAAASKDVTRLYRARSKVSGRHYYYTVKPRGLKNLELESVVIYVYKRMGAGRAAIHATALPKGDDMLFSRSRDEVRKAVEGAKKGSGIKRRVFYRVFYVLENDPNKTETRKESAGKK